MIDEPKVDVKKVEEFLIQHPKLVMMAGLVALVLLQKTGKVPAWVADLPALSERLAGPWRGPGSFGHGFGPQARHR